MIRFPHRCLLLGRQRPQLGQLRGGCRRQLRPSLLRLLLLRGLLLLPGWQLLLLLQGLELLLLLLHRLLLLLLRGLELLLVLVLLLQLLLLSRVWQSVAATAGCTG